MIVIIWSAIMEACSRCLLETWTIPQYISKEETQSLLMWAEDILHQVGMCSLPFAEMGATVTSKRRWVIPGNLPLAWFFCTLFREALWSLCCQYLQLMEKLRHRRQVNYSVFHFKSGPEVISLYPWKKTDNLLKKWGKKSRPLQVQNPSVLFGIGNNLNVVWDCLSVPGHIYKPCIILIILTAANAWLYMYIPQDNV